MFFFRCGQTYIIQNIHILNLILLCFVFIGMFDVDTPPENAKLAILEQLRFQVFFAPYQP